MIIGIDASRANVLERTGTEWYAYYVIEGLKKIIPCNYAVVLYSREALREDLAILPPHWRSRVLAWPPQFLWTQFRLSWEQLWHRTDLLYLPAHTIPIIHSRKIVFVAHDVGFVRQDKLYDHRAIGAGVQRGWGKKMINAAVRLATLGRYGAGEADYHRFSMARAIKYASQIITVSNFSKKEIMEVYGVADQKIRVIYNGFRIGQVNRAPDKPREMLRKLVLGNKFLFFVGRLELKKNIPTLINAFYLLKTKYHYEGKLVLAGRPGYGYDQIRAKVQQFHLSKDVIELGWLEQSVVEILYKQCDAFVFPSLYEGFGIPILEALAANALVVCSRIPALHEVGNGAVTYFDPESSENIAATIQRVFNFSKEQRDLLKVNAQKQLAKFSWQQTAEFTWQEITKLL